MIPSLTKDQYILVRTYIRTSLKSCEETYYITALLQIYNEIKGKENSHVLTKSHQNKWYFDQVVKPRVYKGITELLQKNEAKNATIAST